MARHVCFDLLYSVDSSQPQPAHTRSNHSVQRPRHVHGRRPFRCVGPNLRTFRHLLPLKMIGLWDTYQLNWPCAMSTVATRTTGGPEQDGSPYRAPIRAARFRSPVCHLVPLNNRQQTVLASHALPAGLGSAAFSGCYIYALSYTTLADAFLLTNSSSILLLLTTTARDFSVAPLKLVGTIVSMLGAWVSAFDPRGPGQGTQDVPRVRPLILPCMLGKISSSPYQLLAVTSPCISSSCCCLCGC
jgi:hypothetical protein